MGQLILGKFLFGIFEKHIQPIKADEIKNGNETGASNAAKDIQDTSFFSDPLGQSGN